MSVHSGRFGTIDDITTVRQWSINDSQTLAEAIASNTAFGKARRPGVNDWTGSFQLYGVNPPVMPGDEIAFVGYTAPDNDAGGAGIKFSGNAVISQLVANWNWQNAEVLNMQADFGGQLELVQASGAVVLDASTPDIKQAPGTKIEWSDNGSAWTELENIATATLTLQNAVQTYVNSSTYLNGRLWTGRKKGNIDWTLQIVLQDNERPFDKGDQIYVRLYVDATNFWLLKFARVQDFTGIQINRESGAIIQQTINLAMDGVKDSDGSLGQIVLPDDTVWWPVAQT